MGSSPDPPGDRLALSDVTVLSATGLEAGAVHRALPAARVVRSGVGLSRLAGLPDAATGLGDAVLSCGLAGSLRADLPTGTVLVPARVLTPDGAVRVCDPALVAALAAAARRLGLRPEQGPLATVRELAVGAGRRPLADLGCVAVDMETGLVHAERIAAVRVVLDTPERELSGAWRRPATALLQPAAWRELPWLARHGPRCARLAARVLAAAFSES